MSDRGTGEKSSQSAVSQRGFTQWLEEALVTWGVGWMAALSSLLSPIPH